MEDARWTIEKLEAIKTDRELATVFMNRDTFEGHELKYYPYSQRKEYQAAWGDDESITFYATDDEMVKAYLALRYNTMPDCLVRVEKKYISIL
jgi:hypothetical protein